MKKLIGLLAVFLASSLSAPGAEVKTVTLGVCLSLTGEFSNSGKKVLAGIRLRLDDFNKDAARTGMRLELAVRDAASKPETAVKALNELADLGVPAVIGPLPTMLMLEMAKVARERKVVLLSPTATSPLIGRDGDWAFRLLFDDEFQGVALARYARRVLGAQTAASVVNRRLKYSSSVADAFRRTFVGEGGKIVAEESYEWVASEEEEFDFHPILEKLAARRPELTLLPVNSIEIAMLVHQSLDADLETRFCGGDTWLHENILETAGHNVNGSFFVNAIDYEADTPQMRRFTELYDNSHDPDAQPSSVLGYDSLSLLIEALKGGDDAESLRAAMYRIAGFPLATGIITIDPVRGSEKTAYIYGISREGDEFVFERIDEVRP